MFSFSLVILVQYMLFIILKQIKYKNQTKYPRQNKILKCL